MATQRQIDVIKGAFLDSVFAMFFPNIATPAGDALLDSLVCYLFECYPNFQKNCPALWKCFYLNWLAYTLSNWPVEINATENGDGSISVSTNHNPEVQLYLNKRTIGGKTCEWKAYESKCNNCDDGVKNQWKFAFNDALATCEEACGSVWGGSGSNWPSKDYGGCCGSDRSY